MADDHLVYPEQSSSKPNPGGKVPRVKRDPADDEVSATTGKDNRGSRPGTTRAGEVTGSGASAGGGGNPEDMDTDTAAGGSGDVS